MKRISEKTESKNSAMGQAKGVVESGNSETAQTEVAGTAPDTTGTTEHRPRPQDHRFLAQGDVILKSACGDLSPEEGAIHRAVCMAFLLAADGKHRYWHPEHLDQIISLGIEIMKRRPEELYYCGHPGQIARRTIMWKEPFSLHRSRRDGNDSAMAMLNENKCYLVERRGRCIAAISKHRLGESFLLFHCGWEQAPELRQIEGLKGLYSALSTMGAGISLTPLQITNYRARICAAPPFHDIGKIHHKYKSTLAAVAARTTARTAQTVSSTTRTPQTASTSTTTTQTAPTITKTPQILTWRVKLPGEYPAQDAKVRNARSRVEGRPPCTLTEQVVWLEGGIYNRDNPDTVALRETLLDFVQFALVQEVGRYDPLFAGAQITLVGSHGDGTDVRPQATEFDILVSLPLDRVRVVREEVAGRGVDWSVWFRSDAHWNVFREAEDRNSVLTGTPRVVGLVEECKVDPEAFLRRWANRLDVVMSTVTLPEGLTHDGPLTPRYTGVKVGDTTVTQRLVWQGETRLTCDLTAAFPVPRDALNSVTQKAIGHLERATGLGWAGRSSHPVHVVPGLHGWLPTTCVVETQSLGNLDRCSPPATLIRGLKLLARLYLQWRPLDEMENEVREAKDTLAALGVEREGCPRCIGGLVDTEGLSKCVRESLKNGRLMPLQRRKGDEIGVHWSRMALVIFATHKAAKHRLWAAGCWCKCGLCKDLTREARNLLDGDTALHLHPAVGEAVGIPPSPQLEVCSAFLKYLVLSDLVRGGAEGDERVAAGNVDLYMRDLATHLESGRHVPHPLLSHEGVGGISPRSERGIRLMTSNLESSTGTRSLCSVWSLLPESLLDCHAEVCRQLCDVAQVT